MEKRSGKARTCPGRRERLGARCRSDASVWTAQSSRSWTVTVRLSRSSSTCTAHRPFNSRACGGLHFLLERTLFPTDKLRKVNKHLHLHTFTPSHLHLHTHLASFRLIFPSLCQASRLIVIDQGEYLLRADHLFRPKRPIRFPSRSGSSTSCEQCMYRFGYGTRSQLIPSSGPGSARICTCL